MRTQGLHVKEHKQPAFLVQKGIASMQETVPMEPELAGAPASKTWAQLLVKIRCIWLVLLLCSSVGRWKRRCSCLVCGRWFWFELSSWCDSGSAADMRVDEGTLVELGAKLGKLEMGVASSRCQAQCYP